MPLRVDSVSLCPSSSKDLFCAHSLLEFTGRYIYIHMAAPRSHIHTTDGTTSGTSVSWPERLTELARLACTSTDTGHERDDVVRSLHYHLDAIEGILCDPRPEITQELERCRPKGGRLGRRSDIEPSGLADPGKPKGFKLSERRGLWDAVTEDHWDGVDEDGMEKEKILSQLRTLMKEVTMMKVQLRERRKESNKICDLYEERCRGLERTIAELEFEVVEL